MTARLAKITKHTVSHDWDRFHARLVEVLGVLGPDEYLILSHPHTDHFVQFVADEDAGFRAEAKSNHYIAPKRQLGPDQELRLVELGWNAPTHRDGEERVSEGSPNWFRDWEAPVDLNAVARIAVMTLREVYAVRKPGALRYKSFRAGGGEIRLPTLGVGHDGTPDNGVAPRPEWLSELKRMVSRTMVARLPWMGMRRLKDGALLTELENTTVVVAEEEDPFQIRFTAALMPGTEETPDLLAAINQLNGILVHGRLFVRHEQVRLAWSIPADPFHADQFTDALLQMHELIPAVYAELRELLPIDEEA